ncbi:alpha/beta fold hydrolase [Deinococcus knuensis]|uniref:Hydrolase n=1 Tax=Deinococcus knuensis TaxID=1837380 RepID=A0ABQ2SWW4_9DEIO|nr:alpha/beta fold hydrolase [Deinococcus knuensis]GGS40679.1 hydrolase [Deinococcus knuensis]
MTDAPPPHANGDTVLLHGFGTSGHLWRAVCESLSGAHAPDLMGFGTQASAGRADQGTADMGAALLPLLRSLHAARGPVTLAGHSMGGKVALWMAATHPDLVRRLVLIAPSPPTPEPMSDEDRAALRAAHGDRAALRAAHGDRAALTRQYRTITRQPLSETDFRQLVRDGLRASPAAWTAWTDHGSREDITARLVGLRAPVTVLYSAEDPAIAADTLRAGVLPLLPGAQAREVRGSGHLLPLEQPAEVAAALLDV